MHAPALELPSIASLKRLNLADTIIRRNALLYGRIRQQIEDFEALAPHERRRWRAVRLERLLRAARRTGYGRTHGCVGPLAEWPLLDKESVRDRQSEFLATSAAFAVQGSTSGTSGIPLTLKRSIVSVVYEQVMFDRLLERAGVAAASCRAAVLRGDDVKDPADRAPPYWRLANGGRRLIFSSNHLDRDSVEPFVRQLRAYQPELLLAYPTVLESLCALMLERGLELAIPVTLCASEVLTRHTAQLAARALNTRVIGHYGQAERVGWAASESTDGYRFDPSYSINELVPIESEPDADIYELIGTGLWNRAMPLVRYRTGDQIRLRRGADSMAVAEGREPFLDVIGRNGDFLVAPSGARLMGIDHIPRGVPNVVRTQFIQESPERVRLLVVPAAEFGAESLELLGAHAALKLPPSMTLAIETTNRLERNASGKTPLVVRRF
ncbi:MAG: hypothetical protein ACREUT_04790 [Steroidobacteraceae bacterium]